MGIWGARVGYAVARAACLQVRIARPLDHTGERRTAGSCLFSFLQESSSSWALFSSSFLVSFSARLPSFSSSPKLGSNRYAPRLRTDVASRDQRGLATRRGSEHIPPSVIYPGIAWRLSDRLIKRKDRRGPSAGFHPRPRGPDLAVPRRTASPAAPRAAASGVGSSTPPSDPPALPPHTLGRAPHPNPHSPAQLSQERASQPLAPRFSRSP